MAGPEQQDVEVEWQLDAIDLRPVERWFSARCAGTRRGAGARATDEATGRRARGAATPSAEPEAAPLPLLASVPGLEAVAQPVKRLVDSYSKATGLDWKKEHGEWNVAHKILLGAGIPTIEQVGGDVDIVNGKRMTLAATPWKFEHGDACPVRVVAMFDPSGKCRIEPGK